MTSRHTALQHIAHKLAVPGPYTFNKRVYIYHTGASNVEANDCVSSVVVGVAGSLLPSKRMWASFFSCCSNLAPLSYVSSIVTCTRSILQLIHIRIGLYVSQHWDFGLCHNPQRESGKEHLSTGAHTRKQWQRVDRPPMRQVHLAAPSRLCCSDRPPHTKESGDGSPGAKAS